MRHVSVFVRLSVCSQMVTTKKTKNKYRSEDCYYPRVVVPDVHCESCSVEVLKAAHCTARVCPLHQEVVKYRYFTTPCIAPVTIVNGSVYNVGYVLSRPRDAVAVRRCAPMCRKLTVVCMPRLPASLRRDVNSDFLQTSHRHQDNHYKQGVVQYRVLYYSLFINTRAHAYTCTHTLAISWVEIHSSVQAPPTPSLLYFESTNQTDYQRRLLSDDWPNSHQTP